MARPKRAEWLNTALLELYEVAAYIQQEFGTEVAQAFLTAAYETAEQLLQYPEIGRPITRYKTVRYVHVGKHHRMYYRAHGSVLYLLFLFDERKDPSANRYR
ncbi:MAG: type II toxin-antitoxin system RelE/ParE family toxin [Saprospiraceae bacterium]